MDLLFNKNESDSLFWKLLNCVLAKTNLIIWSTGTLNVHPFQFCNMDIINKGFWNIICMSYQLSYFTQIAWKKGNQS